MNIFVTGGGGFLGFALIKELLKAGHKVTSFSRREYVELQKFGVNHKQGSLNQYDQLMSAMKGHDLCFHVASKVAMAGAKKDFFETNVKGTKNVIRACQNVGIKYLVHTSTPSVVFGHQSILNGDEGLKYPKKYYSLYAESKALAERFVLESNSHQLKTVALRPHLIFGPGDGNLIPGILEASDKKKLKIIGKGDNLVDVIYIDNAVSAHLAAMKELISKNSKCSGKAYFIGQGPVKLWAFINQILEQTGRKKITRKVPYLLCYLLGMFFEFINSLKRLPKEKVPMTRFVAMQLSMSHYFSHKNATKDLNWQPHINIDEAIKKTGEAFK